MIFILISWFDREFCLITYNPYKDIKVSTHFLSITMIYFLRSLLKFKMDSLTSKGRVAQYHLILRHLEVVHMLITFG